MLKIRKVIKKNIKRVGVTNNKGEMIGILEQIDVLSHFANHTYVVDSKIKKVYRISPITQNGPIENFGRMRNKMAMMDASASSTSVLTGEVKVASQVMVELADVIEGIDDFSIGNQEKIVEGWIESKEYKLGDVMNAFRLALVGESKGPHIFDIIAVIGKDETIARIQRAVESI